MGSDLSQRPHEGRKMKRTFVLIACVVLLASLVAPATASAATQSGRGYSLSGDFWYTTRSLGSLHLTHTITKMYGQYYTTATGSNKEIRFTVYSGGVMSPVYQTSWYGKVQNVACYKYPNVTIDGIVNSEYISMYNNGAWQFSFRWTI